MNSKNINHIMLNKILALILVVILIFPTQILANTNNTFIPAPQTPYAEEFITKCEGQAWFMNEVENILNAQSKSINTLESSKDLDNIYALGLANQEIEGKIPVAIGELSNLRYLYLSNNKLSGEIPEELYNLSNLEIIDISENSLSGQISPNIANLTELKVLMLHTNQFTGNISSEITQLSKLENLDIAHNQFEGNIPPNIGNLTNLKFLSLADNKLTGDLPSDLGSLTKLEALLLWSNNLTGTIPANIENMTEIKAMDLSQNKITGTIPDSFSAMENLEYVDLSQNLFVGDVSPSLYENYENGVPLDVSGNYMYGENLKNVDNNSDNFMDGFENNQNALMLPEDIQIPRDEEVYIYENLKAINPVTTDVTKKKLELPGQYYTITLLSEEKRIKDNVEIGINEQGLPYVKLLAHIDSINPALIEIKITDNNGSEYSKTTVKVHSGHIEDDNHSSGGIVGYVPPTPTPEVPTIYVQVEGEKEPMGNMNLDGKSIKYLSGYEDGTIKPDDDISREEMAYIIYAINKDLGESVNVTPTKKYADVYTYDWSAEAIDYVTSIGIMTGYPDGTFKSDNKLTRAEMSVIIAKYSGLAVENGASTFDDANGHWAETYINAANKAGYMSGYPDGSFKPEDNITRAEVVSSVNRLLGIEADKESIDKMVNPFTDLPKWHWAYYDILEVAK